MMVKYSAEIAELKLQKIDCFGFTPKNAIIPFTSFITDTSFTPLPVMTGHDVALIHPKPIEILHDLF
jgi:hypothetical protein